MNERTDTTTSSHRMRFELIFGSAWLAIGFFFLPAVIFWVGITLLGPYGEGTGAGMGSFYGDFYGDLADGEIRAWALALGPLVIVSIVRAIFLGTRPQSDHPVEAPDPVREKPSQPADVRRVEPRIGAD